MAASAPPIVWAIAEFARRRRIDALSILVLAGVGLSLLVYLSGGSVRVLQLREKLVTSPAPPGAPHFRKSTCF